MSATDLRRAIINRWHAGQSNSEDARRLMHTLVQGDIRLERNLQIDQQGLNGMKVVSKILDEIVSTFIPDVAVGDDTKITDLKDDKAEDRQTLRKSLIDAYFDKDRENNFEFVSMYLEGDIDAESFQMSNTVANNGLKIAEKCGEVWSKIFAKIVSLGGSAAASDMAIVNVPPPSPLRRAFADPKASPEEAD